MWSDGTVFDPTGYWITYLVLPRTPLTTYDCLVLYRFDKGFSNRPCTHISNILAYLCQTQTCDTLTSALVSAPSFVTLTAGILTFSPISNPTDIGTWPFSVTRSDSSGYVIDSTVVTVIVSVG